ncbi:MAG: NUDIX hydrolase [Magnetococcales bacterium]|nr:NUDIX hydrolase [Magnetococcales bacterium]
MIVRPGGLIVHERRLLLMRYVYGGKDRFNIPGGKPDPGENLRQCLRRELVEELNLELNVGKLLFLVESEGGGREVLHPLFRVEEGASRPEPRLNRQQTSALDVVWMAAPELRRAALYPHIPELLAQWLEGVDPDDMYLGRISQSWT